MISNQEILRLLDNNEFVKSYDVLDFFENSDGFLLKIKIYFIDQSVLFSKEYFSRDIQKYSFYWQDKNNNLILRWDNAPYHKDIITFPHHKHKDNGVFPSKETDLYEVIVFILNILQNNY